MFLNFDFFLQLLYMAWVFGFKAWSTTRASVTPLDRVIEHSKSARVVTSFFVTTVPASPTEVETSIRTDVSAFTSQGMDWELTTPGRDRRWILGSLTYKDGNLNHLSCIGHCKGLLDFLGWCPPELTSTKLPVLNPKSSPCCKSMLAVPRFSNHRLPDFVSTTSMPGSRAVVVVASILDFNQFRTPNPTFSNNAWYMFWVELVGDKKTQKSCYILNSKPKGWLADSKSDTLTAASCKRLFQFNGRSPQTPTRERKSCDPEQFGLGTFQNLILPQSVSKIRPTWSLQKFCQTEPTTVLCGSPRTFASPCQVSYKITRVLKSKYLISREERAL